MVGNETNKVRKTNIGLDILQSIDVKLNESLN
jgi:hypothetical protein